MDNKIKRQEQIEIAASDYAVEYDILQLSPECVFQKGAEWADEHPNNNPWHDLRKNPNDLPEDFRVVLVIVTIGNTRDIVKVTHTNFAWIGNVLHGSKVIAWMEIPEFK